jgi:hypothetical protein
MSDQFSMFDPPTSEGTTSATSLPESAAGPTPSDLPDGPTTAPSGPAPVPVSRFRARASKKAMPTNDTSGPLFTNSSPSADLQRSLENRLRQRMAANGSPEYALTWKMHDMPSGPPICALRASGRRTSGKGCSGWPTPNAGPQNDTDTKWQERRARIKAEKKNGNGFGLTLGMASQLAAMAGWPTPMAGTPAQNGNNAAGDNDSSRKTVELVSGWPTPKEQNSRGPSIKRDGLWDIAQTAGWATPTTRDWKDTGDPKKLRALVDNGSEETLGRQVHQSPAPTESHDESPPTKPASLNPAFSLWLMGYPIEWARCAARVMRSSRKSRQPS